MSIRRMAVGFIGVAVGVVAAHGGILMFNLGSGIVLPDDESGGVVSRHTVTGLPSVVQQLRIRLQLEGVGAGGMLNGDIYATLSYQATPTSDPTAYSVLLNRPGWDYGDQEKYPGYADNGMDVSLGVSGSDVHLYQSVQVPAFGAELTGNWAADGRDEDPWFVTNGTGRTAGLEAFQSLDPNGVWTLYVEDLVMGGQARLKRWGLEWTPVPVPEPAAYGWLTGALMLGVAWRFRQR